MTGDSRATLFTAARIQGLDPSGAALLQAGHHHVYRLPAAGAVAKVHQPGTTFAVARRQNRAAFWLRRNGILAPRPTGRDTYPVQVNGMVVTFADDLGTGPTASPTQLAELLRTLHDLAVPHDLALPTFDPFPALAARIAILPPDIISAQQRLRLRATLSGIRDLWREAAWQAQSCVIHGDVGPANSIVTPAGEAALLDGEHMSVGPALWDLAAMAWRRDLYGADPAEYEEFCTAYGTDATTSPRSPSPPPYRSPSPPRPATPARPPPPGRRRSPSAAAGTHRPHSAPPPTGPSRPGRSPSPAGAGAPPRSARRSPDSPAASAPAPRRCRPAPADRMR
ncbi:phosphotransferase [Kitasatospora sp. NPDC088548]|uniref:phosphotransferase n=1 Tax=Kitasatospora sp. NPDC088548 TaxID=3364075 RepID=UPI0038046743